MITNLFFSFQKKIDRLNFSNFKKKLCALIPDKRYYSIILKLDNFLAICNEDLDELKDLLKSIEEISPRSRSIKDDLQKKIKELECLIDDFKSWQETSTSENDEQSIVLYCYPKTEHHHFLSEVYEYFKLTKKSEMAYLLQNEILKYERCDDIDLIERIYEEILSADFNNSIHNSLDFVMNKLKSYEFDQLAQDYDEIKNKLVELLCDLTDKSRIFQKSSRERVDYISFIKITPEACSIDLEYYIIKLCEIISLGKSVKLILSKFCNPQFETYEEFMNFVKNDIERLEDVMKGLQESESIERNKNTINRLCHEVEVRKKFLDYRVNQQDPQPNSTNQLNSSQQPEEQDESFVIPETDIDDSPLSQLNCIVFSSSQDNQSLLSSLIDDYDADLVEKPHKQKIE